MNGPFQVAQASTPGATNNNNSTTRIFSLTKPLGDQAVTINLGYDQKVKVDFSAIANEKITLVHLGDKLIILFDNKSTLTIEPFFDSRHDGLNNLSVEVAPGRDVSVSEFASLFPITTDQSVLPAAGDGNGNAQASGANFSPASVDPLGIGNPLALLGQEELGTFVTGVDTFDGTPNAAAPTIAVGAGLALTVDESFIPVVGSLQLPAGSSVAVADYSTVFAVTAPGGVASQTYALTATGTVSNLIDTGTGQTVVLVQKGAGEVDGIVTIEGATVTVFTLTVDAAGHVTMTDLRAVHEANPADSNDGITLAAGLVSLTVTVTDFNTNTATATLDLGPHVTILDDGPTITAHEGEIPSLNVDESFLAAATNAGVDGSGTGPAGSTTDHGFFAGAFTSVAGADGATIAYTLGIGGTPSGEGGLIDSGLIDSATGQHVVLVLTPAGVVEGHVGTAAGETVFTLTIDAATAEVTLTQLRSVHEGSPDSPDDTSEGISLDSVANLVTLTATITDGDGDKATASIDLGTRVTFHDDGPSIEAVKPSEGDEGGGVPSLNVDESFLTAATNGVDGSGTGPAGATTDHASFAGMFTSVQGADHATVSYILGIAAPEEEATLLDSGLIDSATGQEVVLVLTPAGVVEGHVGTADGETVFTLTVDAATADVTLTQFRAVHENTADNPTDSSEGISLNHITNLVTLTAIITDNDGDSASASIDLGALVTFHDDGPSIVASEGKAPSLQVDESFLTAATNGVDGTGMDPAGATTDHASFAGMFTSVQGADHATIVYTLGIATPSQESESNLVDSGLIDSATGQEVVLVLTAGGAVEGHVGTTGGALVFTLTVDAATAEVTLTQLRSVHENDPTSNNEGISLDHVANLVTLTATITDNDGDSASASIDLGANVTFYDDGPTLSVTAGEGAAVVDETPGLQTASGATDVAFSSLTGAIQTLFNGVLHKGFDPDVGHDHSAIGYAVGTGLVTATVNYGADHGQSEVFALTLGHDGMDSGLKTTEGREIFLFLENGVIVGRYDAPNDGNTTVNHSDPAAFAIAIDPATGQVSLAQYVSLNHPDQATAADGFNSYNEAISLASGTVSISVTVTDNDNDSVTKAVDVSGEIKFLDDGPKVTVVVDRHFSVVLDETPGVQSQDDDTTSSTVRHLFDSVTNPGNDPDLTSGEKDHGAIGFAIGSNAALDVTAVFGADGPSGGECTNVFSLTLNGISGYVDSGLQTTDGKEIYLTLNDHGVIVGRVDTDGDHHVTASDPAAFAIAIDSDGHVATAEYLSLRHPDPHADDESVQLAAGTVSATVTITDGDGDTASASADISGKIQFEDDVPVAHDVTAPTILDDEAQTLFTPVNFGGSGDVSPSVNTTSGGAGTLFDSGADGTKTVSFAAPSGLQAIYKLPSGLAGQEIVDFATTVSGGHTILTATGHTSHNVVFTLDVAADGSYTFKVSEPLVDPVHSTTEENLSIKIGFTVTDGDGDQDTGSLTVKVNDDTPTVEVDQAQQNHHDVTLSTLTLDESIGTMAGDSNAATDDVSGVTTPTLLTLVNAAKAIGIVSTPTSDHGTSVADLFETHVSFGADGPKAAAVSTYSLTLKDDHGSLVTNSHTGVETNLVVTELAGTALQGTSDAQRTVYLFQASDGSIVGRIGNNPNGDIALHIMITGSASDPQITVEQYLPMEHSNHNSADESTSLTFDNGDASLGITLTVTATDGDGDVATDSKTVSLADCNTSLIKIEDDGPTVSLTATAITVVHDETPGLQTAADPNPADDVQFGDLSGAVRTAFTNVANPGSDPDLTAGQMDHGAIGFAKSAASLVNVTTDFGTDGAAISNATVLGLALGGIKLANGGVDSGLKTTDGHEIDLFLENGLIVGRYDGTDGNTTITNGSNHSSIDPAAFAIAISQDGTVSLAQYVSLKNPLPGSSYDEPTTALKNVVATVTVTDGDGDTATKSLDISGQIQFQDDGPTLSVAAPAAINGFDFGTFAINNEWGAGSGIATGTNGGWTIADANQGHSGADLIGNTGGGTVQLERVGDGYEGMHSSTGGFMVDLDASPRDVKISQTVTGLADGQTYDLRFEAGAPFPNSSHLEVWFGGVKVGDIAPAGQMQEYMITLTGGSGDHSNLLEFRETGSPDNQGTYLANVSVGEIVIDETAGIQADSNEIASSTLFDAVAHKGSDPDMAAQFAQGTSAAVSVAANFGADGPLGGSAAAGTVYSLTTNNVDSGLTTTSGQAIHLFNETYNGVGYVVGRYDSNNSGTIDGADDAAFAFTIDPGTGKLSLVQYVSLHQPNTASYDEGVFLKTGSLSVNVTITDGDGDAVSKSADISANVRFDDDGPHAVLTVAPESVLTIDETAGPDSGTNDVANIAAVSGLFGAIPGTPIEIAQGSVAVVSASASSYGADGQGAPATYALNVSAPNGVDSGIDATDGRSVFLFKEGNLIVGREATAGGIADDHGSVAFAIAIDGSTGKLTVAEYTGLYHHNPLDPNEAATPLTILNNVINATVTITDGDGDTSTASVGIGSQIHFLDDGPTVVAAPTNLISNGDFSQGTFAPASFGGIASAPGSVTGWVFSNSTVEAPAPGGLQVERVSDGYLGLHSSTHGSMIDMAASPGNIQLSQQVSGLVSGQTYAVEFEAGAPYPATAELQVLWNNVVIGTIDPTGPMTSYSYVVTATGIAANDQITFREVGLGHAPIPGEADEGYHGTYLANIAIVATSVVDEDGLTGPLSFGNHDSQVGDNVVPNTDGDNNEATATGNLNINWGADNADKAADTVTGTFATLVQDTPGGAGNRSVTFTDANVSFGGASSLTSQGVAITFSLNADHTILTGSAGDRSVFQVSLSDDGTGSFRFVLLDQLDHAPNGNENDIALTFNYTVTDSDGDTASSKFIVSVDDDVPVTGLNATITVDEDDLASGNHDTTSPGDDAASITPVTGTLNFSVGADEPATVGFASLNGAAVVDTGTHAVTAGGIALHYYWDSASHTLYASTSTDTLAHATATAAFKIQVTDPATGAYSFSLLGQVDHPGHNDGVGGTQTAYEDNININLTYTVTDRDNDTAAGTLSVSIDDDIPIIGSGAATNNLIVNGSFELGHDDLGNNQWSIYHTITGWTSKDIGPAGTAGDVPFELQTGNVGGVFAQDGNTLVELDSDLKSGDLTGGDHFNDSGHTNATIQQVVAGTQAGQSYELTFYYAPRPGEGDADSGSMEVLWNGTVVKTIDSTGMTPGVWQLITVSVVGTGPGDVLAFQGTGQENTLGAFIDNVSLVPVTFVDEDGLTGPLSKGNHDSQPGDNIVPDTDNDHNEATSTGKLNIKWGADNLDSGTDTVAGLFGTLVQDHPDGLGDRSVTFTNTNVAVDGVSSLTSHGQAVTFSLNADGTILTGVAGTRTVMEISLSDEGTGAFRVVLLDQLDHAPGNNENDIHLTFNFTATDSDGDAVKGNFTVGVDDDVPVATGGSIFIGEVFEGGLGNGLAPTKVTFSGLALASMVSVGADEPATFGLNGAVTGVVHDSNGHDVTSQGVTVKYAVVGGDVIGFADTSGDNLFTSGEHEIFRLHDNGNGLLTFTLEGQVDNAGSSASGGHPLILNLATAFKATDFDGDSTVLSGSVSFGVESGTTDPIVLDLGKSGLAFTSQGNGVQFDINGDGAKDQVAWTANGEGGILALDVDGSGKIENGNELFTPGFAGGHFANGIAALASLDANHDGVIDSKDPAFSQLVVWQDANHNGVSDAGELTKLTDLGIKSIDLATTADAASIDGQHVAATGTFTYVDGSKGSFVEVDFDTTLGTTSTPTGAANGTHSDLPKSGMDQVVDFTPAGHGELNFAAINPGVPAGGEKFQFSTVDAPLMHDAFGDNSAAAAKMALAILQAGGTVDTAHLPVAH
jgi:T1SS-143 domain-containing protein